MSIKSNYIYSHITKKKVAFQHTKLLNRENNQIYSQLNNLWLLKLLSLVTNYTILWINSQEAPLCPYHSQMGHWKINCLDEVSTSKAV